MRGRNHERRKISGSDRDTARFVESDSDVSSTLENFDEDDQIIGTYTKREWGIAMI